MNYLIAYLALGLIFALGSHLREMLKAARRTKSRIQTYKEEAEQQRASLEASIILRQARKSMVAPQKTPLEIQAEAFEESLREMDMIAESLERKVKAAQKPPRFEGGQFIIRVLLWPIPFFHVVIFEPLQAGLGKISNILWLRMLGK